MPRGPARMRIWFFIALADLVAAAVIGLLLRIMFLVELPFVRFRPWLHGHSHVALLGWLFIGLVVVLLHDGGRGRPNPRLWLVLTGLQLAVVVMLFSFPLQGYGAVSIAASSVHLLLAFAALSLLWRASRHWHPAGSGRVTRLAIVFFALSTLGILAIGPIIATGHQGSEVYYWAVQFFLHFQFNGWFWFAAMALGLRWAERQGHELRIDRTTLALWVLSALFTYALAIAWSEPLPAVFATVSIAVAMQVWAAWRTFILLRRMRPMAGQQFPLTAKVLIGTALVSMGLKVLVQASVAIPSVAVMALTIRHFVMGFIHMNTLGTMTALLLAYAIVHSWCDLRSVWVRVGIGALVSGIVASELLLFIQGTFFWIGWGMIPGHYLQLVIASALMPLGVAVLLLAGMADRGAAARGVDRWFR